MFADGLLVSSLFYCLDHWDTKRLFKQPKFILFTDIYFVNFGTECGTQKDAAVATMPANDDAIHPSVFSSISFETVTTAHKVFFHRPRLG